MFMKKLVLLMVVMLIPVVGFSYTSGYESEYMWVDKDNMSHARIKQVDFACQNYCMQEGYGYGYCKYQCEYEE